MKRQGETVPDTLPDDRRNPVRIAESPVTHGYLCGHMHESRDEAQRCAEALAARLSSKPMPSDYYLG